MATIYEKHVTITMPGANDFRIRREHQQMAEAMILLKAYLESQGSRIHGSPETARKKMLEMLKAGLPETLTTEF
jgi:hypothetical protein